MSLTPFDLWLYAGAMLVLFLTPGPVWLALMARGMGGGFPAAWPLALGVAVGDILWPLLAVLGVTWVASTFDGLMVALKYVAVVMFAVMGILLIRNADRTIAADSRLTRPGAWAGFMAGLAVILGNPKAILFYMGMLPGFFDLASVTPLDIVAIVAISFIVPLGGNLTMAFFIDRLRRLLASPRALRRTNIVSGVLLIVVAGLIAVS
ncbi:LysE family translocator [Roseovarius sp. A21]|uniref:LysE family translocator n=1 Tax=Roseovarius bejariae TaxID=2576383 RepID=A0A844CYB5_9RHOB|nr:LysE family translocator [Roseovarius bejariae]MRU15630.1 LysE family translocator [Roseovarius bejariae]